MNEQALELNNILQNNSKVIFDLLSKKGKEIFFPKKGILSQSAEAKGKKINATIGEAIDDNGYPLSLNVIQKNVNIDSRQVFPYAPGPGKPEIRKKWKEMIYAKNKDLGNKSISQPIVTGGVTHGLSIAGYLFVDPDDEIIIPDYYWENYDLIFSNAYGAKIINYNLFKDNNMDLESFKNAISNSKSSKKILLLNFPNNPTGYTPSYDEVNKIRDIIKESAEKGNKIIVLIDDAYFGLVYEENIYPYSIFCLLADLHENVLAVKLDAPTKEDYVWGFRIGFITYGIKNGNDDIYQALEQKTAGAIRGSISNCSHLSQSLLLNAYNDSEYNNEKKKKYDKLKNRYNIVRKELNDHKEYKKYFNPMPFNSGYFMCIKIIDEIDTEQLRKVLLNEFDTGIISQKNILRIAYSSVPDNLIPELFSNIYKACEKIYKK